MPNKIHTQSFGRIAILTLSLSVSCDDEGTEDTSVSSASIDPRESIVRVVTSEGQGTGFFVKSPSGDVLVATAFHVIASGADIRIEQQIDVSDKNTYRIAYPETELVAFDQDADIALIRLKNVPASNFKPLALGEPKKDMEITSWGFPASVLVESLDLTRKEGRLSNLVRLDVHDRLTGQVLKENAVPGLIVSTALEPGFSGGPTINDKMEVVGINILKDSEHDAQNACVEVAELKKLLDGIRETDTPTIEEVQSYLLEVQNNYLRLTEGERAHVGEVNVVSLDELPRLRELVSVILEAQQLGFGGQTGITLAKMPGRLLPNFDSDRVRAAISECRKKADALSEFLDTIGSASSADMARCEELGVRALINDLLVASLRWDGAERQVQVSKVEEIDAENHIYRANVSFGGQSSVPLHLGWSGGRLRLRFFGQNGHLSVLEGTDSLEASALSGEWMSSSSVLTDSEQTTDEVIRMGGVTNGVVTFVHTVTQSFQAKPGYINTCNGKKVASVTLTQYFAGELKDGSILAEPSREATVSGAGPCLRYSPDKLVRIKSVNDKLLMVRTDDSGHWPETEEFGRR